MKIIELEERNCDCCGSDDLEEIWKYTKRQRTKQWQYEWRVRNVICRKCGFAFVSPAPRQSCLDEYYGDSFELFGDIQRYFSFEKRIHMIRKYIKDKAKASYIEVGGNENRAFFAELSKYVETITTIELNKTVKKDAASLESFARGQADIIAAFYVLEHIPSPKDFFYLSSACLKHDGVLLLEVPDLYIYPTKSAGLLLHEHVNHFSPRTLSVLAASNGFSLVEINHQSQSRNFGFVAVFVKSDATKVSAYTDYAEYILAKSCMQEGLSRIQDYYRDIKTLRLQITTTAQYSKPVILWGANRVCTDILDGFELPSDVFIVDSDPQKRNLYVPITVYLPDEVIDEIKDAGLIIINTEYHAPEIFEYIQHKTGRKLSKKEGIIFKSTLS